MNWLLISEIIYIILLVLVCLRIIYDTRSNSKSLAYLLFAIFVPIVGSIFYFSFGINYRKRKIYSKKLLHDDKLRKQLQNDILQYSQNTFSKSNDETQSSKGLAMLLLNDIKSPLTTNNEVKLLINGENKFPAVLEALKLAKEHIHFEYYIYEDDEIGNQLADVLIQKAKEGVIVRFIYDDFGSRSIRKKLVPRLKAAGVFAYPFNKVIFFALANRLNYRNHRKIIVIDGITAFVGGINVSDRYINKNNNKRIFWRDTHLQIIGPGVHYLQYLFLCDWNFCAKDKLKPTIQFFPTPSLILEKDSKIVQIAASGPDSDMPTILYTMLEAIHLAKKEILITTPYFIPGESLLDALTIASLRGIIVKLLVPGVSDSLIVNTAARSYYGDLLNAGVEIYLYDKGFIHAKTVAIDQKIAIVGTANMDYRSFDLNFEVNAVIYDREITNQLIQVFLDDIKNARQINSEKWQNRVWYKLLVEKIIRLISPLL
jgi:cardiolipin synthase